jgi:cytidylate kinase
MAGEHADIKLWLTAPLDVRADRIAQRENKPFDQARTETEERSRSEAQRYAEYYDIDFEDLSIYDLTVNTARWDPQGTLSIVLHAVDSFDANVDEGQAPVEGVRYEF